MSLKFSNYIDSVLSTALDNISNNIVIEDASKIPELDAGDFIFLTLLRPDELVTEVVKCILAEGNVLTVIRAQDGSTAETFPEGSRIASWLTSEGMNIVQSSTGRHKRRALEATKTISVDELGKGYMDVIGKSVALDVDVTLPSTTGRAITDVITFCNVSNIQGKLVLADPYDVSTNPTGDTINGLPLEKVFIKGEGPITAVPDATEKVWFIL